MIEVPAAAICADIFAKNSTFFLLAQRLNPIHHGDRSGNDEVNYLYDPLHPAVLRLITSIIKAGKKANIPVSMCGEIGRRKRTHT